MTSATPTKLPPEIIDVIIDALHSETKTLRVCSLVCKNWNASARFHLFSLQPVRINERNSRTFLDLITSHRNTILPYIRSLKAADDSGIGALFLHKNSPPLIDDVISTMAVSQQCNESVVDLVLQLFTKWPPMALSALARPTTFPNVRRLAFDISFGFTKLSESTAIDLICSFQHLEYLCITLQQELQPTNKRIPSSLRRLQINSPAPGPILRWLCTHHGVPALERLSIEGQGGWDGLLVGGMDALQDHLEVNPNIRDLHLGISLQSLDLSKLLHLQKLDLTFDQATPSVEALFHTLKSIQPDAPLTDLTLRISRMEIPWTDIQKLVLQFQGLERLVFSFDLSGNFRSGLETLPGLFRELYAEDRLFIRYGMPIDQATDFP